jgi:uncharacterized protein YbjQ (UPF0145 family)
MDIPTSLSEILLDQFAGGAFWYLVAVSFGVTVVGYVIGFVREQMHFFSLKKRERKLTHIQVSNSKTLPASVKSGHLVSANVAMATDSFRILSVTFRRLFGGNIKRYEKIKDRARREALIRLREAAITKEFDAIFNIRLETSQIRTTQSRGGGTPVEVLVYGTAVSLRTAP